MEFIIDNAIYVILALGSAIALLWPSLTNSGGGVPTVSPAEAVMLMSRSKPVVLDVREETEFAEGHIQGAKHIPVAELAARIKEVARKKSRPVLVVCQHGMRSGKACQTLTAQEFTEVYSLQGGLNKWAEAKMPLVKGK